MPLTAPLKYLTTVLLLSCCGLSIAAPTLRAEPDVNLVDLEREDADSGQGAIAANKRALELYRQGTPETLENAIAIWEENLAGWETSGDTAQITQTLTWLGAANHRLGQMETAQSIYERLLSLHQTGGDRFSEAQVLSSLSELAQVRGDYEQALQTQERALLLWQDTDYRSGEALSLNQLGLLAHTLGQPEQAIEYYKQVLAIVRTVENKSGEAAVLNNLGQVYDSQGKIEKAIPHYRAALNLWSDLGDRRNQATALNNLGYVQIATNPTQARVSLKQALELWQAVGDRRGEASTLSNLGVMAAQLQDYETAAQYQKQALDLRQKTGDRLKAALTHYRLAIAHRQSGRLLVALDEIRAAVEIIENLRTNVERQELRTSFFATQQDYYEFYIDLLMELDSKGIQAKTGNKQATAATSYKAEALLASESAKARSLLDVLVAANADIRKGVSPQLLDQERQLTAKLDAAEKRRVAIFAPQSGGTNTAGGQDRSALAEMIGLEIRKLVAEYEQVQSTIRASSPQYAALTQPEPLNLTQIQNQVLDKDTVLLEYFLGGDRSFLWVVSQTGITSYTLPGKDEITTEARRTYRQFGRSLPPERILSRAKKMSEMLIAPAMKEIQGKRLLVVADGVLNYLPFAALQAPAQLDAWDYQPLLQDHEVVMMPSASTLGVLRQEHRDRPKSPQKLAILADPVFGLDDERVQTKISKDFTFPASLSRAAAEANVLLSRLPFTRQEAETITALFDPQETIAALGIAANREFVTNPNLGQYQMVHFATHGLLNSKTPELSGLALSLINGAGEPQNGFLRFHEIFNLDLNAELVVLSACQTGVGPVVRGEGALSLTRGFMYAGAERVVVSLWNVDDRGTAELMAQFYQEMLNQGLTPAAALRAAQLEMAGSEEWRSPYYWAAFTLQGEWN